MKTARQPSKPLRPRFMPVLIASAAGLLAMKLIGLTTQGGYILANPKTEFAKALSGPRTAQSWAVDDVTNATPAKKPAPEPAPAAKPAEPQPLPAAPVSSAEREVLEQLGQRRKQLDERGRELELREQLLKSAEKIAQERIDELKRGEARQNVEQNRVSSDLKAVASMYESMKPKDAARVFDKIDSNRLLPLARQMNPKKLAEVLAAMSPEGAEKLTLLMLNSPAQAAPAAGDQAKAAPVSNELQRLPTPNE